MSTLLIVHGDEGCPHEIHGVILLDQTFDFDQTEEVFERIKDDLEVWVGDYSQEVLTPILAKHGLSGISVECTVMRDETPDPTKMYYNEVFC